jgi:hypothetical protein
MPHVVCARTDLRTSSCPEAGTITTVELIGWNSIPDGYGASFELKGAPWWLRVWFHTPLPATWIGRLAPLAAPLVEAAARSRVPATSAIAAASARSPDDRNGH